MKINRILLVIFFIVALLGSIAGTSYYYIQCNKAMTKEVFEHLESVAQSRAHHVNYFLEEQEAKLKIVATHQELTNEELKEIKDLEDDFYELFILNSNGKVTVSSDELQIGKDKSNDDYFVEGLKGIYIKDAYYSETTKKNSIAISTPFNDGVLVARIELISLDEITKSKNGLGETGEIYLINSDSYTITPLLFKENSFLKQRIDTINSRNCLEALDNLVIEETGLEHVGHEAVETFLDYKGEKVIGTHYPIPKMNWCLITEIDEKEILGRQRVIFQRTSLTIIIAIVIISVLLGLLVGKFVDDAVVLKKKKKSL